MRYEWDNAKDRANKKRHGVAFKVIEQFDWAQAIEVLDDRFDYGEERWLALGLSGPNSMPSRSPNVKKIGCVSLV